ncbi:hypothetical protein Srufu_027660 [Streptomyces libani subsp. rufus]|nr:hypothetical protein Srufu_027660 [Streptomyces libani subsp. rufus]
MSVKRQGRKWFVVLSCDDVPPEPLPATGREVGIDMGTTHFLTTTDGVHIENPRLLSKAAAELAAAQRNLSQFPKRGKTKTRTKKHRQAVERVAKLHAKIRRQRLDHAHKAANFVVRDADVIAHERLDIANMTPRPKPRAADDGAFEPNGAAAKAGLNRAIFDAGWGVFLAVLTAKAECAGRQMIAVNPRNTSRTCPLCRHVSAQNRDGEGFQCTACGFIEHADTVGALNTAIRAGLALCVAT